MTLERWDETNLEYYALDTSTHPKSSWAALSSGALVIPQNGWSALPTPYKEY